MSKLFCPPQSVQVWSSSSASFSPLQITTDTHDTLPRERGQMLALSSLDFAMQAKYSTSTAFILCLKLPLVVAPDKSLDNEDPTL